ncbi:MAG: tetratricopeptide repeat protein [Candidatus Rifleibacteriota bacterium]
MILNKSFSAKISLTIGILLLFFAAGLVAQTPGDVEEFLSAGQKCYAKGDLDAAAIEFENVLLIDETNFSAQVWLAQVYADLKNFKEARRLLRMAAAQAPDHPRVEKLQKLLGTLEDKKPKSSKDSVIQESFNLLGKNTGQRKYGLVIPEEKIKSDSEEKRLLVFDDLVIKQEKPEEKKIDLSIFEENEESPLRPALDAWNNKGLASGLEKYFQLILDDPALAAEDDDGMLSEARDVYVTRLKEQPDNLEARYYVGMINFVDGLYGQANLLLTSIGKEAEKHKQILDKAFVKINEWKEQEKERLLALKREEEERLARELAAKEKEKEKEDVWESLKKNKKTGGNSKASDKPENPKAKKIHDEGYGLYKKGKLEEAIAKFETAIEIDNKKPDYHYHLGLAWTDKGLAGDSSAFDRAVTEFQRVISLDPGDKMVQDAQSMIRDIESAQNTLGN